MIDNTTKTRAIFEINKGTNKNPGIDVNAKVVPEDRRIPLQNMIYIADGPSDVPSFSVVKKGGGKTYAVYNPAVRAEFGLTGSATTACDEESSSSRRRVSTVYRAQQPTETSVSVMP